MSAPPAGRVAAVLVLGGLMAVLDTTATTVAVPRLVADLHASLLGVQWLTIAYALALVAVMPTAPWLAGRVGAGRAYLGALALFTTGSLLSGLAPDLPSLLASRVLQGLGGGLLGPLALSIALAVAGPERRGRMLALLGLPVLVGPLVGPVLAGVLVDHASWRWIFGINVPVGLAALAVGRRTLPRGHGAGRPRLDAIGAGLLSPGLALLVLALSLAGTGHPPLSVPVAGGLAVGVALVGAFVRHAAARPDPLLDVGLLRTRSVAAGAATLLLFAAAYFGTAVVGPVYVQLARADSATVAGALGIPQALATGVSLQVATRLTDRVDPRRVVGTGIVVAAAGTLLRVAVLGPTTSYVLLGGLGVVTGLGIGAVLQPTVAAASRGLDAADLPSGSTLLTLSSQLAVVVGTALVTVLLDAFVRAYAPGLHGGLGAAPPGTDVRGVSAAVRATFAVSAGLMVAALGTSRLLPAGDPRRPRVRP